ncbi:hypothetical protein BDZ45DRAFT_332699 [Acephala macrosclerotiorum]|nr:hypothetical protein BDZ45DRAFT_332699 [Acephala macrosclerotiorum]
MEPALLPEIYLHTAQFISSPSTLASCCLVSKEFHRMFVPYLYRHLNLRSGPPTPDQKSQFDPASSLRRLDPAYLGDRFLLTKHFEASVRQNNDALISSYLWSMPNIVSLSIDRAIGYTDYSSSSGSCFGGLWSLLASLSCSTV